ncbi:Hypothetical predicted protein [Marmota monax]|uniref:Uncharacterized protein n=1 Tax=Marmota monax TaxID=9995 RepID=A0A5E4AJ48_MARMO|nr:hypothetical protein GHT09_005081 [Marmota monax]VTJ56502.1 Hypothetical predicted protein [Marmota monax]
MILTVGNVTCWLFGTEDKNTRDKGYKWRLSSCLIIGGHESPEDSELLLVRISGEASCSGMRCIWIGWVACRCLKLAEE